MRKIKIEKWKSKISETEEKEEDLLMALNILLGNKRPEDIPKGLDKFRLFHRLSDAFEEADKMGILVLEEGDYNFLKQMIEKDIPSTWGMNKGISKAFEDFLEAKQEN